MSDGARNTRVNRPDRKRPDLAFYQPGVTRLSSRRRADSSSTTDVIATGSDDVISSDQPVAAVAVTTDSKETSIDDDNKIIKTLIIERSSSGVHVQERGTAALRPLMIDIDTPPKTSVRPLIDPSKTPVRSLIYPPPKPGVRPLLDTPPKTPIRPLIDPSPPTNTSVVSDLGSQVEVMKLKHPDDATQSSVSFKHTVNVGGRCTPPSPRRMTRIIQARRPITTDTGTTRQPITDTGTSPRRPITDTASKRRPITDTGSSPRRPITDTGSTRRPITDTGSTSCDNEVKKLPRTVKSGKDRSGQDVGVESVGRGSCIRNNNKPPHRSDNISPPVGGAGRGKRTHTGGNIPKVGLRRIKPAANTATPQSTDNGIVQNVESGIRGIRSEVESHSVSVQSTGFTATPDVVETDSQTGEGYRFPSPNNSPSPLLATHELTPGMIRLPPSLNTGHHGNMTSSVPVLRHLNEMPPNNMMMNQPPGLIHPARMGIGAFPHPPMAPFFHHSYPRYPPVIIPVPGPHGIQWMKSPPTPQSAAALLTPNNGDAVLEESMRNINQASAMRLINETSSMETALANTLSRLTDPHNMVDNLNELRQDLEKKYECALLLDLETAHKHQVEQALWKNVYYHVIEQLRKLITDNKSTDVARRYLHSVINQGTVFYDNLLQKLQSVFNFTLSNHLDPTLPRQQHITKVIKLALLSSQRCMICLGDLARYLEQVNESANYGKARNWYLKAQQIVPKNGRPYNQLAILAVYTRRKLDAVYYYIRSLAASNPFTTARESLITLFEEARRKSEQLEEKRKERYQRMVNRHRLHHQRHHGDTGRRLDGQWLRREVWVSSDGYQTVRDGSDQSSDDSESDLSSLTPIELNKKFVVSFLNIHGKQFTRIGMEMFQCGCKQLLCEFKALLNHFPIPITNTRLLQLMAINMFSVHSALNKEQPSEDYRSTSLDTSIQFGLDMFSVLLDRANQLFHQQSITPSDNNNDLLCEDLHEILPSISVWTCWMMCQSSCWNPPPLGNEASLSPWQRLAHFCNYVKEVDTSCVEIHQEQREEFVPIILDENTFLSGFLPLLTMPNTTMYIDSNSHSYNKILAEDCVRIESLKIFSEYMCGLEQPLLAYSVEKQAYHSIAPQTLEPLITNTGQLLPLDQPDLSLSGDDKSLSLATEDAPVSDEMRSLRNKHNELVRQVETRRRQEEWRKSIIDDHHSDQHVMIVEIRPLYLIPDTNTLIDHLHLINRIVSSRRFTVIVPLIVINELDGLAKGFHPDKHQNPQHAGRVENNAIRAVDYLERIFSEGTHRIKSLTSRATEMSSIAFRNEDPAVYTTSNDDVILSCCLHYINDDPHDYLPKQKGDAVRLYREAVLLTDDRNLRVKAISRNVPAKTVPAFYKWAKLPP